ncbi:hypothetical protein [Endozoicomonas numazuensis]|nr:hypothetical protein [Endozoicomonas numazuensis]
MNTLRGMVVQVEHGWDYAHWEGLNVYPKNRSSKVLATIRAMI